MKIIKKRIKGESDENEKKWNKQKNNDKKRGRLNDDRDE